MAHYARCGRGAGPAPISAAVKPWCSSVATDATVSPLLTGAAGGRSCGWTSPRWGCWGQRCRRRGLRWGRGRPGPELRRPPRAPTCPPHPPRVARPPPNPPVTGGMGGARDAAMVHGSWSCIGWSYNCLSPLRCLAIGTARARGQAPSLHALGPGYAFITISMAEDLRAKPKETGEGKQVLPYQV